MGSSGLVKGLNFLSSTLAELRERKYFLSLWSKGGQICMAGGRPGLGSTPLGYLQPLERKYLFILKLWDTNIYTGLRDDRLTARVVHGHFGPDPPLPLPACNPNKHNCTWWPLPTVDWSRDGGIAVPSLLSLTIPCPQLFVWLKGWVYNASCPVVEYLFQQFQIYSRKSQLWCDGPFRWPVLNPEIAI